MKSAFYFSYILACLILNLPSTKNHEIITSITEFSHSKIEIFPEELTKVKNIIGSRLKKSRYMEMNCQNFDYPGWENFPTKKCRYEVSDKNNIKKFADVVMLNPSEEKLAKWVITTCKIVKGNLRDQDINKLINHIISASGGQFPIAGIVFEDIYTKDGIYEVYCFRNGVTVIIDNVKHRSTNQPNENQIRESLYGNILGVMVYARIVSTTPNQYINNGGNINVGTDKFRKIEWIEVVKDLYQTAWNYDKNELMIDWAKENL